METMSWTHPVLLLSLCFLGLGQTEYLITINPTKVEVGITDGLTLECSFFGDPITSSLHSISRVRILKDLTQDDFQIIAEALDVDPEAHNVGLGPSANVTGLVGDVTSSYLSIYWDVVTSSILGRYRCDVVGFKANQDVAIERTPVFVLKDSNVTIQDVVELINEQKADLEVELQAQKTYCDNRIAAVEASVDNKINEAKIDIFNSSGSLETYLLEHLSGLTADVQRLMDTGVLQYWPQGVYSLLMPASGCPNNVGAVWNAGYRVFHTESIDRNYDQVSASAHMMQPILERQNINNFVYQHFCVSNVPSPGAAWPKGAYCINRVAGLCPTGFFSGSITWQDEITNSQSGVSGTLPDGIYEANSTVIAYCCRNDGLPLEPVYLPKSHPFYLYRFNGTCQEVVGMQSTPEYMIFDTDSINADSYENVFHPDGTINDVRIELCYYVEK